MRNSETGEFELVVGNKQLLSGFFIVVLLFAVAFAMGYVVGQNAPRSTRAAEAGAGAPSQAADTSRPAPAANAAPANPAPAAETPAAPAGETASAPPSPEPQPQPTTQPAREPGAAAPAAAAAAAPKSSEPPAAPPGSYWQVIAIAQPDAEVIYQALKDKGFPAYMSPGPKDKDKNLVRVLVGPYTDTQSLAKAKTDLENAGFPHPFRK